LVDELLFLLLELECELIVIHLLLRLLLIRDYHRIISFTGVYSTLLIAEAGFWYVIEQFGRLMAISRVNEL